MLATVVGRVEWKVLLMESAGGLEGTFNMSDLDDGVRWF